MRSAMRKRVEALGVRQDEEPIRFIRLIQVMRPDLPEPAQERWMAVAERTVLAEPGSSRRRVVLMAHVEEPGGVRINAQGDRYLVRVDGERGTITDRVMRSW